MEEQLKNIVIGIQARSTSTRFPRKVHELMGDKSILEHVVDACADSARYLNRWSFKNKYLVTTTVCIPKGDEIRDLYQSKVPIFEGSEHDVLSRYADLAKESKADYIVRITADCPLIPPYVISSMITKAIMNRYDYFSNVDERCRTAPDGWDCEVISRRLIDFVNRNAKEKSDREHVTTFIRKSPPTWIKWGTVINYMDLAALKISIDTKDDFDLMKTTHAMVQDKREKAVKIYGEQNVHRL